MITDEKAEAAADWIRDNADAIADAKQDRAKNEEMLRVVRSEIFLSCDGSVGVREATAFSSPEYKTQLKTYCEAVRRESHLMMLCKAAETKIEVWRSQSANSRGKL